jgi:sec-independent protein translocase protein TatA
MFSSVLLFFEFGAGEIMFIMLVALLLFGGDKLPELARGLGKGIRDFKDASEGVKREITNQIDNFEAKKTEQAAVKAAEEKPVAENESLVPADEKPKFEPPANSMPVAEISAAATVEAVNEETNTPAEPTHLKETPIEGETAKTTHEEYKS